MSNDTDVAIQLFIQATIMMMQAYQFETISYDEIRTRSDQAGFRSLPFMPPEPISAMPRLAGKLRNTSEMTPAQYVTIVRGLVDARPFVKYYIRTGLRAAQLICRNHLTRLDEGNQYLQFLKREFEVGSTFASGILALVNANATLSKSIFVAVTGVNDGIEAFQEYRFLTIERDTARILVETAQNKLAEFYLKQVDYTDDTVAIEKNLVTKFNTAGGYSFSDALNAVSVIEYQCTREGIRYLLNRSVNNSPSNLEIDAATGTVMFKTATEQQQGTGKPIGTDADSGGAPSQFTGPEPDAYEKGIHPNTVREWALKCKLSAETKLTGKDSLLRAAIFDALGVARKPFLTQTYGNEFKRRIADGSVTCN